MMNIDNNAMLDALRQKRQRIGPDVAPSPMMAMPQPPAQSQQPGIGESLIGALGTLGSAYLNREEEAPQTNDEEQRYYRFGGMMGLRHGGRYDPRKPFIVGEDGAELVDPQSQTVIPNDILEQALRGNHGTPQETYGGMPNAAPPMTRPRIAETPNNAAMPPALGGAPVIPGLEDAMRSVNLPGMGQPAPITPPDMRGLGKPPLTSDERRMGIEREEETPSRLRAAIVTALQGIARNSQNPDATVGSTLAGGIEGIGGAIDPQILNRDVRERNQGRQDQALLRRGKKAQIEGQELGNIQTGLENERLRKPQVKEIKWEPRKVSGKWVWTNDRGERKPMLDEDGKPVTEESGDKWQTGFAPNGKKYRFNPSSGETVWEEGDFSKPDKPNEAEELNYGKTVADLDGKIAAARSAAGNAQAHIASLDADSAPDPYGEKAKRREQFVDELDKANSTLSGLETERSRIPKPARIEMQEAISKRQLTPEQQSEADATMAAILAEPDATKRERAQREFIRMLSGK
jgi:hypothetical protein